MRALLRGLPLDRDSPASGNDVPASGVDVALSEDAGEATEVKAQARAERTVHRRIQERREGVELEGRLAFRQVVTSTFGGLLLGAALIGVVFFTPVLRVRHVQVVGAVHESPESVEAVAGIPDGATLAEVPVRSVTSNIETLPWIRRAEVTRRPPWTLRIEVIERRPVALAEAAGVRAVVDADAVVLEHVAADTDTGTLPRVLGVDPLPRPGVRWSDEVGSRLIGTAVEIPSEMVPLIDSISMEEGEMVLMLRGGTPVRFGPPDDIVRKSEVLGALIEDLSRRQVQVAAIDVSAAGSPAVLPAP